MVELVLIWFPNPSVQRVTDSRLDHSHLQQYDWSRGPDVWPARLQYDFGRVVNIVVKSISKERGNLWRKYLFTV